MRRYTMRLTWIEDAHPAPNDYVFHCGGKDVGRCYFHYTVPRLGHRWHWTIYNSSVSGDELTLADAQAQFKVAYEKLLAKLPPGG